VHSRCPAKRTASGVASNLLVIIGDDLDGIAALTDRKAFTAWIFKTAHVPGLSRQGEELLTNLARNRELIDGHGVSPSWVITFRPFAGHHHHRTCARS
jgi:hypothetical protein